MKYCSTLLEIIHWNIQLLFIFKTHVAQSSKGSWRFVSALSSHIQAMNSIVPKQRCRVNCQTFNQIIPRIFSLHIKEL